jgi:ribose transport system substrate-binding protein
MVKNASGIPCPTGVASQTRRHFLRGSALAGSAALYTGLLPAARALAQAGSITRVGFDHPYNIVPLWQTIMDHAQIAADEIGVELLVAVDDARLEKQLANLQGWIAQKVPAFTVFPLEINSLEPVAKSARDAGLTWITYAGEMAHQSGAILLNNKESGLLLGRTAADWVEAKLEAPPKVVLIEYRESGTLGIERCDGMRDGLLERVPDAEIVATQTAADPATALTVISTILNARRDVNVVLCYNDDGATGAYRAFLNAGFEANDPNVFIGGQDGAKEAMTLIKEGTMLRATSALRISQLARICVEHPIAVANGTAAEPVLQMPLEALTVDDQDKLAAFLADLG